MGKWTSLLAQRVAQIHLVAPSASTDKTDVTGAETGLVSVLAVAVAVAVQADAAKNLSIEDLTTARLARLHRWGWPADEAQALVQRLARRDQGGDDDRVSCTDCSNFQPGRCADHKRAGLHSPEVGRDLAGLLQRCAGFAHQGA